MVTSNPVILPATGLPGQGSGVNCGAGSIPEHLPCLPGIQVLAGLASYGYGLVVEGRRLLYGARLLSSCRVEGPVVSIGNLTAGGTGKTPCVAWVGAVLEEGGGRPAVLTRGYRGGDEAVLLSTGVEGAAGLPVVVDPDRCAGARKARSEYGALSFVLDDGFQHWGIERQLDVVLVDATRPFGGGRLLPAGLLREPLRALRRADQLILTRCDQVEPRVLNQLRSRLGRLTGCPVAEAIHEPTSLRAPGGEGSEKPGWLAGRRVWGLAGIAHPAAFKKTLETLDAVVLGIDTFPDHHGFTSQELEEVSERARSAGAEVVVTTEKDGVRIDPEFEWSPPIRVLTVRFRIREGELELRRRLVELLREVKN